MYDLSSPPAHVSPDDDHLNKWFAPQTNTPAQILTHVYIHRHIHTCIHNTQTHKDTHTCIAHRHTDTCTNAHRHTDTCTHTHMYTQHTDTHTLLSGGRRSSSHFLMLVAQTLWEVLSHLTFMKFSKRSVTRAHQFRRCNLYITEPRWPPLKHDWRHLVGIKFTIQNLAWLWTSEDFLGFFTNWSRFHL